MTTLASMMCSAMLGAVVFSAAGQADCLSQGSGYMYTYTTCVAGSLPCDDGRLGARGTQVLIISNVFHDNGGNDEYPSSVFYRELTNHGLPSANARESHCYSSAAEAEAGVREHMARHVRLNQQQQIFRISMPNT